MKTSTFLGHQIRHPVYEYEDDHEREWLHVDETFGKEARPKIEKWINVYLQHRALHDKFADAPRGNEWHARLEAVRGAAGQLEEALGDLTEDQLIFLEHAGVDYRPLPGMIMQLMDNALLFPRDRGGDRQDEPLRRLVLRLAGRSEDSDRKQKVSKKFMGLIHAVLTLANDHDNAANLASHTVRRILKVPKT